MAQNIEFRYFSNGTMEITVDEFSTSINVREDTPQTKYMKVRQLILDAGYVFTEQMDKALKRELSLK
jgi:hypothetical protein